MAERQVSIGSQTYVLPELFLVMATQNPIEQEGTYPLPEAQLDRFLMHVRVSYPDAAAEQAILRLARSEAGVRTPDRKAPYPSLIFLPRERRRWPFIWHRPSRNTLFS
jgi:MoxR-like ATPase